MTEGLRLVLRHAFRKVKLVRLEAKSLPRFAKRALAKRILRLIFEPRRSRLPLCTLPNLNQSQFKEKGTHRRHIAFLIDTGIGEAFIRSVAQDL
jgi:hypothetical protein